VATRPTPPQPISMHSREPLTQRETATGMHGGRDGRLEAPSLPGVAMVLDTRAGGSGGWSWWSDRARPGRAVPLGCVAVVGGGGVPCGVGVPFPLVMASLASLCIGPVWQGSGLVVCLGFLV
jgi:hypothetical protein